MSENKNLRIIFNTNAPYSVSGYGQQAAEILPRIKAEGYPLACVCFYGLEGGTIEVKGFEGITMYPKLGDPYGSDAAIHHSKDFNADAVFTLQDTWVLDIGNIKQFKNWIAVVPIDHDPVPPAIFERLKLAYRVVTYSKFGYNELKRVGINSTYIQHTVDTTIYKPDNQRESRKSLGLPEDHYIFGMVAANKDHPPRKSFQEVLDAFKTFHDKYEKSALYLHVQVSQQGGFQIMEYAKNLGIERSIFYTPPYALMFKMGKKEMSSLYNALDCLLMPSTNEGFGVPAIEAQSCGKPVITTDFTSMSELVVPGVTGELVRPIHRRFSPLGSYVASPDTKHLYQQMERVYKADKFAFREKCREFIVKNYDSDTVYKDKWSPFLAKVEKELHPFDNTQPQP